VGWGVGGQALLGVAVTEIWVRQVKSYVNRMMLARPLFLLLSQTVRMEKNNRRLLFCVGVKLGLSH
jgi:hypothetical protein